MEDLPPVYRAAFAKEDQATASFIKRFNLQQGKAVKINQDGSIEQIAKNNQRRKNSIQKLVDKDVFYGGDLYGPDFMKEQEEMVFLSKSPEEVVSITGQYVTITGDIIQINADSEHLWVKAARVPALFQGKPVVFLQDPEITEAKKLPPIMKY